MAKRFVLTSSARLESVDFETLEAVEAFLASRKLSEESVYCIDAVTDTVVFHRSYE